jgi:chemotaxis protein MotB
MKSIHGRRKVETMNARSSWAVVALLCGACVSQGKYDEALKSAADARTAAQRAAVEAADHDKARDANAARWATQLRTVQTSLEEEQARSAELRMALVEAGVKGGLSRLRIEQLRRARAAAESRAVAFRDLAVRLSRMMGDEEIEMSVRNGRMVLDMPADVLFASGRTEIKQRGRPAIEAIGAVMMATPRQYQVAGHTDDVPIKTERFRSNWELSAARATEVVRLLIAQGVDPTQLSVAGYAEFDPLTSNQSESGRRRNRRIEITLQPNIDELVIFPEEH